MSDDRQPDIDRVSSSIVTVVSVLPLPNFELRLRFSDRTSGIVEVLNLIRGQFYEPLRDPEYFAKAELDEDLGTVVWPNGADLSPEVLRTHLREDTSSIESESAAVELSGQSVIGLYDKLRGSQLHYGDNLPVLRERIPDESVDLVYLDPPFNSKKTYNAFYRTEAGEVPEESRLAFEDFWIWDQSTSQQYEELLTRDDRVSRAIQALFSILGATDLMAYLVMMAPRLVELRRVLRSTGSLYLHCDQTASHYLKVLLDSIFGAECFLNDVVWLYGLGGSSKRYWPRKHDDLLWYSKSRDGQYFVADKIPATSQRMKGQLKKATDYWEIPSINNMAKERLGFPTQKPLQLLERIIRSSSPEGAVVLDPFCGCGTTIEAGERLNRRWVGIDISYLAIEVVRRRLLRAFGAPIGDRYRLFGQPQSMTDAVRLYEQRTLDFEYWAVSLVDADPILEPESEFDGVVRFPMPEGQDDGLAAIKVGTNGERDPGVAAARRLVESGAAAMGVVIPLHPDAQLRRRAAQVGSWTWPVTGAEYPRVQVVSVEELLAGRKPTLPPALPSDTIARAVGIG